MHNRLRQKRSGWIFKISNFCKIFKNQSLVIYKHVTINESSFRRLQRSNAYLFYIWIIEWLNLSLRQVKSASDRIDSREAQKSRYKWHDQRTRR